MFGLFDWIKVGGGAVAGAAIMFGAMSVHDAAIDDPAQRRAGYDTRVAEVAAASAKVELERKGDDAKLQNLSDYDLCIAALDGRGVPSDPCEQLRGLRKGELEPGGNGGADPG